MNLLKKMFFVVSLCCVSCVNHTVPYSVPTENLRLEDQKKAYKTQLDAYFVNIEESSCTPFLEKDMLTKEEKNQFCTAIKSAIETFKKNKMAQFEKSLKKPVGGNNIQMQPVKENKSGEAIDIDKVPKKCRSHLQLLLDTRGKNALQHIEHSEMERIAEENYKQCLEWEKPLEKGNK
jgi:hypothetical protein